MKIFLGFLFDYIILALVSFGAWWALSWGFFEVFPYLVLLHFVLSFRTVGPTQLGAVLFFGEPIQEVGSGPKIVPFFSCSLVKETRLVIQDQFPGDPEQIDKRDVDVPEEGKVAPIRVPTGEGTGSDDPIDRRMTLEVTLLSRYRIEKGQFIIFLTTIGSTTEARRQIRDTVEAFLKIEFAKRSPMQILADLADINKILREAVEKDTDSWGIQVENVQLVDNDLGKKVNQSLRDVPSALLQKKVTVTNAEAEKRKLVLEGEGVADARQKFLFAEADGRQAFLEAEAIGFERMAKAAGKDNGKFVQAMRVLEEGFAKGNSTFFDSSMFVNAVETVETMIAKIKTS